MLDTNCKCVAIQCNTERQFCGIQECLFILGYGWNGIEPSRKIKSENAVIFITPHSRKLNYAPVEYYLRNIKCDYGEYILVSIDDIISP